MTTGQQDEAQLAAGTDLVPVTLVPVEVFGGDCTCHEARARGEQGDCAGWGYGLMDAVQSWSDCNRAVGRIYRAEDLAEPGEDPARYRKPGEVLTIQVPRDQAAWFERKWGEEADGRDSVAYIRGEVALAEPTDREDRPEPLTAEDGKRIMAEVAGHPRRNVIEAIAESMYDLANEDEASGGGGMWHWLNCALAVVEGVPDLYVAENVPPVDGEPTSDDTTLAPWDLRHGRTP